MVVIIRYVEDKFEVAECFVLKSFVPSGLHAAYSRALKTCVIILCGRLYSDRGGNKHKWNRSSI
jgi:hypothetical protein